jgi:hypothetical protein
MEAHDKKLNITITLSNGWNEYSLQGAPDIPGAFLCDQPTEDDIRVVLSPHRNCRLLLTTDDRTAIGDHESCTTIKMAPPEAGFTPCMRFTANFGQRTFEMLRHEEEWHEPRWVLREVPTPAA